MINIIKTEFLKVTYLRSNWFLLIVAALFGILNTVATAFALDSEAGGFGLPNTETTIGVDSVYANSVGSYVFALIAGILMVTGEFKHGSAIGTFLATPKRNLVLTAKLLTGAVVGMIIQLISFIAAIAGAMAYLAVQPNSAEPTASKWLSYLGAALLSGAVLGVVGIGIGALIKNQAIAVTGSLLWLFVLEGIVTVFLPEIGKYLLSGAITGMLDLEIGPNSFNFDAENYLSPTLSTLVLIGYGIVFALLAARTTLRQDIE